MRRSLTTLLRFGALASGCAVLASTAYTQDTVRVRADGAPVWNSPTLVRMFTVGANDGPPDATFGLASAVAALPDGRFFVYDRKDTVIRRFDAAGNYLGRFGRSGAGPGEFLYVLGMEASGDSLLVVYDPHNSRVVLFSVDGRFRRSFLVGCCTFAENVFRALPNGTIAIRGTAFMRGGSASGATPKWVRYRLDSTKVDSTVLQPEQRVREFFVVGDRASFGERTINHLSASGAFITAWMAPYRFAVTSPAGRTTLVERNYTPVPLEREERAEWQAFARYMQGGIRAQAGRTGRPFAPAPTAFEIPQRKPALRSISGDAYGRVWVEVYVAATKRPASTTRGPAPPLTWREPTTYDVFEESGRYLGRIVLPDGASLLAIGRDRVWLKMSGADGEDVVSAFRIEGIP